MKIENQNIYGGNQQFSNQSKKLPNGIDLNLLSKLLSYSDRYDISIQFWTNQTAVFISKKDVDLQDYGGDFIFAISKSIEYLEKINSKSARKSI